MWKWADCVRSLQRCLKTWPRSASSSWGTPSGRTSTSCPSSVWPTTRWVALWTGGGRKLNKSHRFACCAAVRGGEEVAGAVRRAERHRPLHKPEKNRRKTGRYELQTGPCGTNWSQFHTNQRAFPFQLRCSMRTSTAVRDLWLCSLHSPPGTQAIAMAMITHHPVSHFAPEP